MKFCLLCTAVGAARITREAGSVGLSSAVSVASDGSISAAINPQSRRDLLLSVQQKAEQLMGTKLTDEAKQIIDGTLLPTVRDEIQAGILKEFETTQTMLDDEIARLQASASRTKASKSVADEADQVLVGCRAQEKQTLTQLEACQQERQQKALDMAAQCEAKKDHSQQLCAAKDAIQELNLEAACTPSKCDMSTGDNCGMEEVMKMVDGIRAQIHNRQEEYNAKAKACAEAEQEALDACSAVETFANEVACVPEKSAAQAQSSKCQSNHESARLSKCEFGAELQGKCADLGAVKDLVSKIQASARDDSLSESDRQDEWQAVQRLTCLLVALRDDGDLSAEAAQTCAADTPYPKTFNYHAAAIAEMEADEQFNCQASTIQFSGVQWSAGDYSAAFQESSSSPAITYTIGQQPFEFCGLSDSEGQAKVGLVVGSIASFSNAPSSPAHVAFGQGFTDTPVLICGPLSRNGGDTATAEVTLLSTSGASVGIREPGCYDNKHTTERMDYLVAEHGVHFTDQGVPFVVGNVSMSGKGPLDVSFPGGGLGDVADDAVVVIPSLQTANANAWLALRVASARKAGFTVVMTSEEQSGANSFVEDIGYIAIPAGSGTIGGRAYHAYRHAAAVTHEFRAYDVAVAAPAAVLAAISYNGGDPADVRISYGNSKVSLMVDEAAKCWGQSGEHTTEEVHMVVF